MRNKITKGEAAKLLGITKTQIRFYEKKKLIKPFINENGYTMYDFNMINELEVILFLREMDKPISEIHSILKDKDNYNYPHLLEQAHIDISEEIKRLKQKKIYIKKKIDLYKKSAINEYTTEQYSSRTIHVSDEDINRVHIKEAYDLSLKYNIDFKDFNNELCRLYTKDYCFTGLINSTKKNLNNSLSKRTLPKGEYFSYTFCYESTEEIQMQRQLFYKACEDTEYEFDSFLLFIEHFAKTYYDKGKSIATFQKRILSTSDISIDFKVY